MLKRRFFGYVRQVFAILLVLLFQLLSLCQKTLTFGFWTKRFILDFHSDHFRFLLGLFPQLILYLFVGLRFFVFIFLIRLIKIRRFLVVVSVAPLSNLTNFLVQIDCIFLLRFFRIFFSWDWGFSHLLSRLFHDDRRLILGFLWAGRLLVGIGSGKNTCAGFLGYVTGFLDDGELRPIVGLWLYFGHLSKVT